jgi:hypothetical protein
MRRHNPRVIKHLRAPPAAADPSMFAQNSPFPPDRLKRRAKSADCRRAWICYNRPALFPAKNADSITTGERSSKQFWKNAKLLTNTPAPPEP